MARASVGILFTFVVPLLLAHQVRCQGTDTLLHDRLMVDVQIKAGKSSLQGPALAFEIGARTRLGSLALRLFGSLEELALFPSRTPVEKNYGAGLLYGVTTPEVIALPEEKRVYLSLSAGPGLVTITRRGAFVQQACNELTGCTNEYEPEQARGLGLLYEMSLRVGDERGAFVISRFGSLNETSSYGEWLFGIYVSTPF